MPDPELNSYDELFLTEEVDALPAGREEEALFARDDNDVLVRREKETRERFNEFVTITIDGYPVEIPKAVPKTDALGNPLRGADGELIPRTSSIYDAATRLATGYVDSTGKRIPPTWTDADLRERIPVLCHQPHITPIAVCRMCSVHISSIKRGKLTPGRKLVPACQHRVEKDMVVTTRAAVEGYNPDEIALAKKDADARARVEAAAKSAREVGSCVKLLAEFLIADHRQPDPTPEKRFENELEDVARSLGVTDPRPGLPRPPRGEGRNALHASSPRSRRIALPVAPMPVEPERLPDPSARQGWEEWNALVDEKYPYSSRTVVVDHDRCILCDRCARSCAEVKPFKVIGHTGKGYSARISFDLDSVMGESSCVQCGECMTSCPTGALSVRRRVQPRAWDDSPDLIPQNPNTPFPAESGFLSADEIRDIWLWYQSPTRGNRVVFPFRSVSYAYLKWNEGSVRRWVIKPGERRVLCEQGKYETTAFLLQGTGQFEIYVKDGIVDNRTGFFTRLFTRTTVPVGKQGEYGRLVRTAKGDELVMGEMACLTHRARTATVIAVADKDNPRLELGVDEHGWPTAMVDRARPGPVIVYEVTRNLLDMMQRTASGREDVTEMYASRAIQACVDANKMLFADLSPERRGEISRFLLRSRRLVLRRAAAGETIVAQGDKGGSFYIVRYGTLRVFRTEAGRDRVLRLLGTGDYFGEGALLSPGAAMRAASVAALDPVELVAVPPEVFREMCERFPEVKDRLAAGWAGAADAPPSEVLEEYTKQGLFQGQRILALDLLSCTRCDECTRACADSHDGNARLLRDGLRFGDFLVATSCRSCLTPYCMEGCPVDAIHRQGDRLEVVIEPHCIGCGLCERNCPYGSIHMVPKTGSLPVGSTGLVAAPRRAANCDLCGSVGGDPFCVKACPHDAAIRMTGPDLLAEVSRRVKG